MTQIDPRIASAIVLRLSERWEWHPPRHPWLTLTYLWPPKGHPRYRDACSWLDVGDNRRVPNWIDDDVEPNR